MCRDICCARFCEMTTDHGETRRNHSDKTMAGWRKPHFTRKHLVLYNGATDQQWFSQHLGERATGLYDASRRNVQENRRYRRLKFSTTNLNAGAAKSYVCNECNLQVLTEMKASRLDAPDDEQRKIVVQRAEKSSLHDATHAACW